MNETQKEVFGHGNLETPNDETYTAQQPLAFRKGPDVNVNDRETLAQLRERHDALALYIKKMKEEIANHPVMIERKAARKAEEESVNVKKEEENVDINMDDIDIDIVLD